MDLTKIKTIVLPEKRTHCAPTCFEREHLWFDEEIIDFKDNTDSNCIAALIAEGIGEHRCPTLDKWAAFSIAGAIIATVTGKYIIPSESEPYEFGRDMEHYVWEALWNALQGNKAGLDREFIAIVMRNFIPRQHYCPPDRPYYESRFSDYWNSCEYPDTRMHSVGNVRLAKIQYGRERMKNLSVSLATSICEVARHVPQMLDIAIFCIQKTYR